MTLKISQRGQVAPFFAMEVMRDAAAHEAAGNDVLHLEIGQPSTGAPAGVIAAANAALGRDILGYTDALGIPALRQAIALHYRERYGADLDPGRVVITTGSSAGFVLAFLAAFDVGDRIGLASPSYPAYRNILTALGLVPVELLSGPAIRYQATVDLVQASPEPLDGLIVASPANPTGTMLEPGEVGALACYCEAAGIRLISDEIYHGITYGVAEATALSSSGEAIIVNSFSKYYSMTGWRLGWMVVPPTLLRPIECLAQNLFISPPALAQQAAIAAFACRGELDRNVARYRMNRAILLDELPKAGFDRFAPADGAFYLYADIAHLAIDSRELCRRMLHEIGVACTPGIDFDPVRGHTTLRISYAGSTATVTEAVKRLKAWRR